MLFSLSILILISGLFFEFGSRRRLIHREIARKLLHIISGLIGALTVYLIDDKNALIIVTAILLVLTFIGVKQNLFITFDSDDRKSWGMFFMPLGYLLLLIFFFDNHKWIIFLAMLIESFADSLAGLYGTFYGKIYYRITSDKKSVRGTIVFILTSIVVLISFILIKDNFLVLNEFVPIIFNFYFIASVIIISLITSLFEASSSKGSDNFFVPIIAAFLIQYLFVNPNQSLLIDLYIGLSFALLVVIVSYRLRFLTFDGAIATLLLAFFIFGIGGLKWSIPMLTFFIFSSLLSKLRKNKNQEVESYFEKSGTRDFWQVLANGGLCGLIIILYSLSQSEVYYLIYLSVLASVCADTWATEFGTWNKTATYNILNFQPIEQGKSGGISVNGIVGALSGSLIIAISGFSWSSINLILFFPLVIFSGLFGSIIDSFLGASIQSQHSCKVCEKITEKKIHCGEVTSHSSGFLWVNNDLVNFFAGLAGALFIITFNYLIEIPL